SSRFEHDKAVKRAALDVKRSHGKWRPRVAPSHQHNPAALSKIRDDLIEIRLAHGFPIHIHAARSKLLHRGCDIIRLVVHRYIRPKLSNRSNLFSATRRRD